MQINENSDLTLNLESVSDKEHNYLNTHEYIKNNRISKIISKNFFSLSFCI